LGPALSLMGLLAVGCGSSNQTSDAAVGGPVPGALDDHCAAVTPIVVSQASCHPAGSTADADAGTDEESPVLYNAAGDDDDCKYHVSFTSTPVRLNQNVAFTVTATLLDPAANGAPATGANIQIESYLADNPFVLIPNTGVATTESGVSGVYKISPVKFTASGQWVVRFHLYEDCADLNDDSPHGHIAFLLDVP
jgi:hypothetical protein